MKLTILGCHSATPRNNARTTSQVLEMRGHLLLIDCAEGTQTALRQHNIPFMRIKHIFISHLHGDHFYGLPGLVSTFQLLGRETELHIYAPKGAQEVLLLLLKLSGGVMPFSLIFHELESPKSELILDDEKISVRTIPLSHRVYTNGFLFQEKIRERKLNIVAAQEFGVDTCYYQNIKNGKDVVLDSGERIPNHLLSFDPPPAQSYAFCSDTAYKPDIVPIIKGTQVLYHEATFLQNHLPLAEKTRHSTALQAAEIAQKAQVQTLILGHYSSRYADKELFRKESQTIFPNTLLARDGEVFNF